MSQVNSNSNQNTTNNDFYIDCGINIKNSLDMLSKRKFLSSWEIFRSLLIPKEEEETCKWNSVSIVDEMSKGSCKYKCNCVTWQKIPSTLENEKIAKQWETFSHSFAITRKNTVQVCFCTGEAWHDSCRRKQKLQIKPMSFVTKWLNKSSIPPTPLLPNKRKER